MGADQDEEQTDGPGAPEPPRPGLPSGFATLRDVVSFVLGAVIIANEVFLQPTVEPTAVAVGLTLTGLPLMFSADERKKGGGRGHE